MTDKSIFKVVVLSFFITFTLVAISLFIAAVRRIPVIGTVTGGSTSFSVGLSIGFIRLILIATAVGVVVIFYLVMTRRKLK